MENKTQLTDEPAISSNGVLAAAAATEDARNFLLAHDKLSLMNWRKDSKEDKKRWINHLKPKENTPPFWDECIRLIEIGYS